jgi:hypothetical protein
VRAVVFFSGEAGHLNTHRIRYALLGLFAVLWPFAAPSARSAVILQYDLTGKAGTEVSDPATAAAVGVTGVDLTRGSGLTPSPASNGFSASGWDDLGANDSFSFGFNVQPGRSVTVNELFIATRSSATGPGFINVLVAKDGGPETLLATLTQPNAQFLDEDLKFTAFSVTTSLRVLLRAANNTSANGGTIGSAGTFRVSDYSPDGGSTFQPITLNGSVASTAVPEPSSLLMGSLAAAGLACWLRRRWQVAGDA